MNREGRIGREGGGGGGGGVDTAEVIHQLESEEVRKHIRKQFSKKKKAIGELKGKLNQNSEEKMELRPLSKDIKGNEDSQTAYKQKPSVQTPKERKIFDWAKVNLGFLHSKIIKKMFDSLGVDYTTGKSGNNSFTLIL